MIFSLFYGTQRSTLGLLTLDVLLKESLELPSEVTQYPVEDGGPDISDHITQGTERLEISGSIGSGSMEAYEFGPTSSKLMDAIETLREMHTERAAITVVTGLGVYEDFGFNGVTITRNSGNDKGGNWIDIDAKLIQVIKVELEEADLPPEQTKEPAKGKAGGTEKKGGNSGNSTKEPSNGNQGTAALGLAQAAGVAPPPRT